MKRVAIAEERPAELSPVRLQDFTEFEAKMAKIKELKALRQNLDKTALNAAIEALELRGKKLSAKRVKQICKKVLADMIDEVKR